MLYASIALVVAGIALIVYSFVSRGRAQSAKSGERDFSRSAGERYADEPVSETTPLHEVHIPAEESPVHESPETRVPRSEKTAPPAKEERRHAAKPVPQPTAKTPAADESGKTGAASQVRDKGDDEDRNAAVLYNDASGVVDYEGRENTIDPSFKKYAKLKRIGRGHVKIIKDGINFQLRKKLYRFEFYRIEKMLPGKNYVALFTRGSDEAKLLIFDRESDLDRRLINEYRAFRKRSL